MGLTLSQLSCEAIARKAFFLIAIFTTWVYGGGKYIWHHRQFIGIYIHVAKPSLKLNESYSDELNQLIVDTLDQNKAEDIVSINLIGKTSLADYMIIASGGSGRHVSALADYLSKALKEDGRSEVAIEGLAHSDWVLLDCGDVIVHIFRPEVREFYDLEKMWTAEI